MQSFIRATTKHVVIEPALPFAQMIDNSLSTERILAVLAAFFAVLAAALRIALGATSREVFWMVFRDALLLAAAAGFVPAGRASRLEPLTALRWE